MIITSSKKVFVDTNVFVKYFDGSNNLLEKIVEEFDEICINDVVFSELTINLLKSKTSLKSYDLKKHKDLVKMTPKDEIKTILDFCVLSTDEETVKRAFSYIKRYGLLPNDALILATCKTHNIKYLATFDEDFKEPAKKERIRVVSNL